jgi:hypothetical protein
MSEPAPHVPTEPAPADPATSAPVQAPVPPAPQPPQLQRWEVLTAELLDLVSRLRQDWDHSLLREYLDKRSQAPTHVRDQVTKQRRP